MHAPLTHAAVPLFDRDGMRRIEARATVASGGDAWVLMERAGAEAWRFLLQHWPSAQRIVVACGPGNNGGDGYVLARHAVEAGRQVLVLRDAGHAPRGALAQRAARAFEDAGGRADVFQGTVPAADVLVDALFGIGFERRVDAAAPPLLVALAAAPVEVLSLDVPSGVDASRGCVPGVAVRATRTLQFIGHHVGLATGAALEHVGEPALATLDVPAGAFDGVAPAAMRLDARALDALLPRRTRTAHKGTSGHVLVAGGGHGMGGAALLATAAALRAGAGRVSVATRAAHVAPLLARTPEAMAHALEDPEDLRELFPACDVCALGPGLGRDDWGRRVFESALGGARALVVDADALNLLAAAPRTLPPDCVLTPHPGEAARLLGVVVAEVERDRLAAAHALAHRHGAVAVLKGAGTVVASPDGRAWIINAGNPGMAVAGMGDALTGIVAALRAQGLPAAEAAATGALLHAAAGDRAASVGGGRGLLASDLIEALRAPGGSW